MKKINLIGIIPYLLAVILSTIVIYLLPPIFEEYKLELTQTDEVEKKGGYQLYDDLDGDGHSERITAYSNISNKAAIKVSSNSGNVITQWNINGVRPSYINCFDVYDIDQNGFKEIYIATVRNDSVFLNYFEPLKENGIEVKDFFIDELQPKQTLSDCNFSFYFSPDFTGDNISEIFLNIYVGFGLQPRALYHIDHTTKKNTRTPYSGFIQGINQIIELDNGEVIVCMSTGAPENYPKEDTITYHDRSSWLVCYDARLNYLFPPIEGPGAPSGFYSKLKKSIQTDSLFIFADHRCTSANNTSQNFYKVGLDGRIKEEKNMRLRSSDDFYNTLENGTANLNNKIIFRKNDTVYSFDENFEIIDSTSIKSIEGLLSNNHFDLENDGDEENILITKGQDGFQLIVANKYLKELQRLNVHSDSHIRHSVLLTSLKLNGKSRRPELAIQVDKDINYFEFFKNQYYPLRGFIYLGIFLLFVLFILVIQKVQNTQIKKRKKLEDQILELQFLSMKSQMDPHFIFNVMNSISTAILKEEKSEAHWMFIKMTDLFRNQITRAKAITTSLKDEVEFCRNLFEIEQFRFRDRFEFNFEISDEIDLSQPIPKMLIQLFAENAIKHGIKPADHHCSLTIKINQSGKGIIIEIEDDGIGRAAAHKKHTEGTGKGTQLVDEMIYIYGKLGFGKIGYHIIDKYNDQNKAIGTLVEINAEQSKTRK
ncbi:MAG: histidine kinase [Bacteroidales bacterium]|nr:histidine kinase [Bacteroidales bacterium]MCF8456177.1 histidine kinase [Bacteroidales bacterium]